MMNATPLSPRNRWRSLARFVFTAAAVASIGAGAIAWHKYRCWRDKWIAWDEGSIQELFGGSTDTDRLTRIEFVRRWEYRALKPTPDGKGVWLNITLSKRHCGNWMLADRRQRNLIRPFHLRHPHGVPDRGGIDCSGTPTATYRRDSNTNKPESER
jgi:hypothetical protein